MPNTLLTPTWVTKDVARGYTNKVKFVSNCTRSYDDQYMQAGAKVGYTVNARLPQRFTVTDGQALQPQAIYDQTVPITLTNQKNVAFGWSSAQATMEIQDARSRYIDPAASALANAADVLAYQNVYRDIYNYVGTPGTTPSSFLSYLQAGVLLTDGAVDFNGRVAVLDPMAMITLANTASTLFHPGSKISGSTESGEFANDMLGVGKWQQDPNRPVFTTGTFTASTPIVNGANQTGSTLHIDGWASGATSLKKGDCFTIAGVYSVNPLSYQSTGRLQKFTITADTSDAATHIAALPISPPIITSGQLQTVSNSPAASAAVTVLGATSATAGTLTTTVSPQSLLFTSDAFAFVMADLIKPGAGCKAETVRSKELGFAIRMVEQYQIGTDQNPSRLDILIGAATLQPRFAVRIFG